MKTERISKSYGDKCLIRDFSYQFQQGERIGIIGPNGVGKSTFIRLLLGAVEPDSGHIITGKTVVFGHYLQEQQEFNPDKKVIDIVKDVAPYIRQADGSKVSATKLLEQFMFTPKQQHSFAKHLSGGEKRRLTLLLVLLQNPNFLILDEPTNDLDIDSVQVLEQFLLAYTGCLIVISHDRFFMDKIVDHLFVFEGEGKIADYWGSYSTYKMDKEKIDTVDKIEEMEEESNSSI
ncbi:MAG: ABC-F family ATP-binding cassette domain-containing protein [Candidatus Peribacteria bacterium]|nr:MAG: ABC-F family ATP-binding cassette domain-containing protein [Candidatus Peribacteria bacterium]